MPGHEDMFEVARSTVDDASVPRHIWLLAAVLTVLTLVYVSAVVVMNLPPSAARDELATTAQHVVDPWFEQQWTLFAPAPPTSNTRLYLQVRYRPGAPEPSPKPINLTAVYQNLAKDRWWAPPRLYRVTAEMAVLISAVQRFGTPASASSPSPNADQQEAQVYFAPSALGGLPPITEFQAHLLAGEISLQLQGLLSNAARDLLPAPSDLVAVRGVETAQEIAPYEARRTVTAEEAEFDTGWMPYVATIAR
jgi:hypothetical protein